MCKLVSEVCFVNITAESSGVMPSHNDTGLLQIETNLPRADNYPEKLGMWQLWRLGSHTDAETREEMGQNLSHTKSAGKLQLTTHICTAWGTSPKKRTVQAAGGVCVCFVYDCFSNLFVWLWHTQRHCFAPVFPFSFLLTRTHAVRKI